MTPPSPSAALAQPGADSAVLFGENSRFASALAVVVAIGAGCTVQYGRELFDPLIESLEVQGWAAFLTRPSLMWFEMGIFLLLVRTLLWLGYRPYPATDYQSAPKLSVVIPAYNEGAMVQQTVRSCANASYPLGRLEIIVVDDGSTDDTWTHVTRSVLEHSEMVRAVRFPRNRGKRAALAAGFEIASGDILVTVDSDSIVERDAFLAITGPFRDEKVGAVGGKVCVLNRFHSLLPRMLHVRFILSFDFLRSAQSSYGTVYCCPGALSAYRASVITPLIPGWLQQRFLGTPCTIGEDRALTNDVLASGYKTVYQRTAVMHTLAPETYRKLCRMYLRWDRSYIREETRLLRIMWKLPFPAMVLTMIDTAVRNLRYPVAYCSLGLLIYFSVQDPWTFLRVLLSIGIVSCLYSLYFLRSERSREFLFGVLYAYFAFLSLFWIFPYALATVRERSWMTR